MFFVVIAKKKLLWRGGKKFPLLSLFFFFPPGRTEDGPALRRFVDRAAADCSSARNILTYQYYVYVHYVLVRTYYIPATQCSRYSRRDLRKGSNFFGAAPGSVDFLPSSRQRWQKVAAVEARMEER